MHCCARRKQRKKLILSNEGKLKMTGHIAASGPPQNESTLSVLLRRRQLRHFQMFSWRGSCVPVPSPDKCKRFVEVGAPTHSNWHNGQMHLFSHGGVHAAPYRDTCKMIVEVGSSTSFNLVFKHGTHEGGASRKGTVGLVPITSTRNIHSICGRSVQHRTRGGKPSGKPSSSSSKSESDESHAPSSSAS